MKTTKHLLLIIICVLISLACEPLKISGQWSGALGTSWNNPVSASISRILVDRINQRLLMKRLAQKSGTAPQRSATTRSAPPPAKKPTVQQTNAVVRFRSSGSRLKVAAIVKELGGTADESAQMTSLLTEILDRWDRETSAKGYKNDVALALSSFIAFSASAYHATSLPPDPRVIELRDLIAELMVDSGAFKNVTDRQKQEMYEVLVVFGTMAFSGYTESAQAGDNAAAGLYRSLAEQNLRTVLGMDPDQLIFDENGLTLSGGVGGDVQAPSSAIPSGSATGVIHAGELVRQFEENEIRANQIYGGRRIRIVGAVNSIDSEPGGRASLTFRASVNSYGMTKCFFERTQVAALAGLRTNDEVTVEGVVKNLGGGWEGAKAYVVVENCRIP